MLEKMTRREKERGEEKETREEWAKKTNNKKNDGSKEKWQKNGRSRIKKRKL